jgi:hypothetical protein
MRIGGRASHLWWAPFFVTLEALHARLRPTELPIE